MQFLADVALVCPSCRGRRFKDEVLAVRHRRHGRVADVLSSDRRRGARASSTASRRSRARSGRSPRSASATSPLGQPLSTLSGGEAQRLKLARALGRATRRARSSSSTSRARACTPRDVRRLIAGARRVSCARARACVVVEHDLAVDARRRLGDRSRPRRRAPTGGCVVAAGHARRGRRAATARTARALRGVEARRTRARRQDAGAKRRSANDEARAIVRRARARAQPARRVVPDPARQAGRRHRAERIGQEHARLRRRVRRGAAPLPRDADAVRAPVPADAAAPRRRSRDRRAAVDRARAAHHARRRELDGRDRHRGRPLPAPAVREARRRRTAPTATSPIAALDRRRGAHRAAQRAARATRTLLAPAVARARAPTSTSSPRRRAPASPRRGSTASWYRPTTPPRLAKTKEHTIDLVIFTAARSPDLERAMFDRALASGKGAVKVHEERRQRRRRALSPPRAAARVRPGSRARSALVLVQHQAGPLRGLRGHRRARAAPRPSHGGRDRAVRGVRRIAPRAGAARGAPRRVRATTRCVALSVERALALVKSWKFEGDRARIAEAPRGELARRLEFLDRGRARLPVARSRAPRTLSGGEMQRLRLSAQLGAGSPARSTCSTSRPSACTRATPSACSPTCARSSTPARRCSWSSTTPTPSAPPTT